MGYERIVMKPTRDSKDSLGSERFKMKFARDAKDSQGSERLIYGIDEKEQANKKLIPTSQMCCYRS